MACGRPTMVVRSCSSERRGVWACFTLRRRERTIQDDLGIVNRLGLVRLCTTDSRFNVVVEGGRRRGRK